jgi:hypothetical protein
MSTDLQQNYFRCHVPPRSAVWHPGMVFRMYWVVISVG